MPRKKLRILIAKFGEGYEKAMLILAHSCCMAGFEVVYIQRTDPEAIAVSALQEGVAHIGITAVPGATVDDFARLFKAMDKNGVSGVRVTAGGVFPAEDVETIKRMGVVEFYPGGSIYGKIEKWTAEYGGVDDTTQCAKFE